MTSMAENNFERVEPTKLFAMLSLSASTSSLEKRREALLDVAHRVPTAARDILGGDGVEMTIYLPARYPDCTLGLLYAALGPAAAAIDVHLAREGGALVQAFESGSHDLRNGTLYVPVHGFDGTGALCIAFAGVSSSAPLPISRLGALCGHSGLLELTSGGFTHPPPISRLPNTSH